MHRHAADRYHPIPAPHPYGRHQEKAKKTWGDTFEIAPWGYVERIELIPSQLLPNMDVSQPRYSLRVELVGPAEKIEFDVIVTYRNVQN